MVFKKGDEFIELSFYDKIYRIIIEQWGGRYVDLSWDVVVKMRTSTDARHKQLSKTSFYRKSKAISAVNKIIVDITGRCFESIEEIYLSQD